MGGIEADIDGRTRVENIWAAGEVACHSMHGANRLGCNSTAECLVWGGITGREIASYLGQGPKLNEPPERMAREEEKRIFDGLLTQSGTENPAHIRRELRTLMDRHAGVYRTGDSMQEGLNKIAELKQRFRKIAIQDKSRIYNSNLIQTLETENMLELAEVLLTAGCRPRGIARGSCPDGFPETRRREVPGPLHGLLHGRRAEAGIQACDDYRLEAGRAKVLRSEGGWHG